MLVGFRDLAAASSALEGNRLFLCSLVLQPLSSLLLGNLLHTVILFLASRFVCNLVDCYSLIGTRDVCVCWTF